MGYFYWTADNGLVTKTMLVSNFFKTEEGAYKDMRYHALTKLADDLTFKTITFLGNVIILRKHDDTFLRYAIQYNDSPIMDTTNKHDQMLVNQINHFARLTTFKMALLAIIRAIAERDFYFSDFDENSDDYATDVLQNDCDDKDLKMIINFISNAF